LLRFIQNKKILLGKFVTGGRGPKMAIFSVSKYANDPLFQFIQKKTLKFLVTLA
jgi:hypothetical protein